MSGTAAEQRVHVRGTGVQIQVRKAGKVQIAPARAELPPEPRPEHVSQALVHFVHVSGAKKTGSGSTAAAGNDRTENDDARATLLQVEKKGLHPHIIILSSYCTQTLRSLCSAVKT